MDTQQGPDCTAHGTLLTAMWSAGWEGSFFFFGGGAGRMDTCIHMAESLSCSPETTTTLFVNWVYPDTKLKV